MNSRTATRLTVLVAAIAAWGCSSSSTGFSTTDSGSPGNDGGTGSDSNVPGDSNVASDSNVPADSNLPVDGAMTPVDGGDDGGDTYDFGCGGNTACPLTKVCCATPGMPTTFACADEAACPAGDKIACDGPDECVGTPTPVCCGVAVGNGTGSGLNCGVTSVGTSCTTATACPTHLETSCSDTSKVQICHFSSDCTTESNNNMCCTFTTGSTSLTFCTDQLTALGGGATCH